MSCKPFFLDLVDFSGSLRPSMPIYGFGCRAVRKLPKANKGRALLSLKVVYPTDWGEGQKSERRLISIVMNLGSLSIHYSHFLFDEQTFSIQILFFNKWYMVFIIT